MQHLLDFVQEHMISDTLRIVVAGATGEVEVLRRRAPDTDNGWLVRGIASSAAVQRVPHTRLLETLQAAGVDMCAFQSELHAWLATQVTFAELVLRNAAQLLGAPQLRGAQAARRELHALLWLALQELEDSEPARTAHLTLVT